MSIATSPSRTLTVNGRHAFEKIDDDPHFIHRGDIPRDNHIHLSGNGVLVEKSYVETCSEQARAWEVTADGREEGWIEPDDEKDIPEDGANPGYKQ